MTTLLTSENILIDDDDFGVELSDDNPSRLEKLHLTENHLANGNTLGDMKLPAGTLVMMIRRGDRYIIPNGKRRLQPGNTLLITKESESPD